MFDFLNKTVFIVGGSSGIGLGCAKAFYQGGANVIIAGRCQEKLQAAYENLSPVDDGRIFLTTMDLKSEITIQGTVKEVIEKYNKIDILVNCGAEGPANGKSEELDVVDWQRVIDTDLTGTFLTCKHVGQHMLTAGYGRIINLASFHTIATYPQRAAYGAAKAGVVGLTQALAVEWGGRGISINAVSPGPIATPRTNWFLENDSQAQAGMIGRTPNGKIGEVDQVAHLVAFLATEQSGHISGQNIVIDGAWTKNAWWGQHPLS